jgi:hypothetical protein
MEAHGIPFPSWYERTGYQHPKEIWIDGRGCYLTYRPLGGYKYVKYKIAVDED